MHCLKQMMQEYPFQPTPSARRVTRYSDSKRRYRHISTHTLRKEGDNELYVYSNVGLDFNPHPPQGG